MGSVLVVILLMIVMIMTMMIGADFESLALNFGKGKEVDDNNIRGETRDVRLRNDVSVRRFLLFFTEYSYNNWSKQCDKNVEVTLGSVMKHQVKQKKIEGAREIYIL